MREFDRVRHGLPRLALLLAAVGAAACGTTRNGADWDVLMPEAESAATTRIAGSVAYMDLEGGLYVLRTDDGTNYDPTNLPEAYRTEGAAVEADVVVREDMASIGMVGPIVDIVRIRVAADESGDVAPD